MESILLSLATKNVVTITQKQGGCCSMFYASPGTGIQAMIYYAKLGSSQNLVLYRIT